MPRIKNYSKGTEAFPCSFLKISDLMSLSVPQKSIEDHIESLLQEDNDVFLVELKILPGNHIKVFLDADNGITIEKCIRVNRGLYKFLEEKEVFTNNDFSLEVSSPGVDEPLKLLRQYKKNIGRTLEVALNEGISTVGKLISVNEEDITIEESQSKGKKSVAKTINILFNQIKHAKVQVTF